jgi:gluconolactonase
MHPSLTVCKNEAFDFFNKDFEIVTLVDDCLFTEGPLWNSDGYYLFSDIPANCIYRIEEGKKKEVFIKNSGADNSENPDLYSKEVGSNGLAYNANGDLLICRHGSGDIAKFNGKKLQSFFNSYQNKPFNSPNDLIVHADGKIYFSDPPYGLKNKELKPQKFQPIAGVYCFQNSEVQLICDKYQFPNGVCLSPDGNILYICSNKPFEKFIYTYDTTTNGFIKIFAEENSDGIKCDKRGNVYLANKDGIIILDKMGQRLALIQLPTISTNLCWGGKDLNDLFITARENVFLIQGFLQ